MASIHNTSAETWDLPAPIIVGCKIEVAEKLMALVSILSIHKICWAIVLAIPEALCLSSHASRTWESPL